MIEDGLAPKEALVIQSTLYGISIALHTPVTGEARENILAQRDVAILRLLELRKENAVPFPTSVTLLTNPLIEIIHPYSRTPFLLEPTRNSRGGETYSIESSLRNLRKTDVVGNSLQALDLLIPYKNSDKAGSKFLTRTTEEIAEIEAIRDSIPAGTEVEKRRYLRELRDKLIIDRFITVAVNKTFPLYSNIQVDRSGKFVIVTYFYHGKKNKQYFIEEPDPRKYSPERNEKLSILLAKLGLA